MSWRGGHAGRRLALVWGRGRKDGVLSLRLGWGRPGRGWADRLRQSVWLGIGQLRAYSLARSQAERESVCVCVERLGTGADKEPCAVCPAQRTLGGGSLHAREVLIVDRCPGWLQSYRGLVVGIGGGGGCKK